MKPPFKKPLTPEQLAALPDVDINYSDIPELDATFWEKAEVTPPKTKTNLSLRLDQDVINFFKAENPKGHTARMAAVLSAYVKARSEAERTGG